MGFEAQLVVVPQHLCCLHSSKPEVMALVVIFVATFAASLEAVVAVVAADMHPMIPNGNPQFLAKAMAAAL